MSNGVAIGAVHVHDVDVVQGGILIEMQDTVRNISIIVVVFSIATVSFILWLIMRRINSILAAIISVREGEYNYRVNVSGSDELALLGDEFNRLTERLRETDEVRRHFVANASHELKTPLASIRLLSDSILQNQGIERETVHEFVEDIGTEAERLARTTEKLMTLTRLDSHLPLHLVAVDMRDAVNSTLRRLRPFAGSRNLVINCELEEACFVMATEDAIDQIVYNLVENAIKYNKPNGKVFVGLVSEAESAILTVADTGIGVPDEDMPYIFDRFYRVDKARSRDAGGSGLGLSIVRDTVHELNGTVTAEQLKDGGMVFEVRFVQVDGSIDPTV
jgi:signal transduction histidine kinase